MTILGLRTAQDRVDDIRSLAGDPEAAHAAEDSFHLEVLQTIATGVSQQHAQDLCRIALQTAYIDFSRWCA